MKQINYWKKRVSILLASSLLVLCILAPAAASALSTGEPGPWQTSGNTLPDSIRDAATTTYNGYVYVVGGAGSSSYLSTVSYAKLNSDGTVGSWVTSGNVLPSALAGPTAVAYNGFLYAMGGYDGGSTVNTVYYAALNGDGSVGSWTTSGNTLPVPANFSTAVVNNGFVYVMGGTNFGTNQQGVYYAALNGDGSVGSWTTSGNSLPQTRVGASSVVYNNYVYVIGGSSSGTTKSTVYYAALNGDGSVGSWATASNALPQTITNSSSVVSNGYVYELGGYNGSTYLSTVYYAALNGDGSVGSWATASNALPIALREGAAVSNGKYVYFLGGYMGSANVNTVYYSQIYIPAAPVVTSVSSSPSTQGTQAGAPDTGYGLPSQSNPIATALMAGAVVAIGAGLSLLYRHKKTL